MTAASSAPIKRKTRKAVATQAKKRPRAVIYVRISDDYAGKRAGVASQLTECEEFVAENGWELVRVYDDNDSSAFSGKPRLDFLKMIADAKVGEFDVVVAWASDRLYRLVDPDLGIIRRQLSPLVEIHTVRGGRMNLTSAEGWRRAQDTGSMSEYESAVKGERVAKRAKQRAVSEGRTTTSVRPFGWNWADEDPKRPGHPRFGSREGLVVNEAEADAVRHIFAMVADGGSVRGAARWLREHGFTGTRGAVPTPETVRAILLSARHAGLATYKGEVTGTAADGLSIVSVELYEKVGTRLSDPTRRTSPGRPAGTLLSGIARCGKCEGPMNASAKHTHGTSNPVYICARHMHLTRRRSLVDEPVIDLVAAYLLKQERRLRRFATVTPSTATTKAATEVLELRDRLEVYAAQAASGALHPDDYLLVSAQTRARLADSERRAAVTAGMPAVSRLLTADDLARGWRTLAATDVDGARTVLRELLDAVVVEPAAVPGHPTDADVHIVPRELR